MKKILLALTILSIFSSTIFAQQLNTENPLQKEEVLIENTSEEKPLTSSQYFEIELIRGTQNPITKKIPLKVVITPKINSSKTQILWNVPTVFTITKNHSEFVSLNRGQTYTFTASLEPKKGGQFNISVNVISWQTDSNKANSASININLSNSLVVTPIETMYIVYIIIYVLLFIGVIGLLAFLLSKGVKILVKKAKIWFTPPY
jgi:hypothetical protein